MESTAGIHEYGAHMSEVHKVTIQVKAPRGTFPGEVAIGYYCVVDGYVVLTDESGKPVGDKRSLDSGIDARSIACRMVRGHRSSGTARGFNSPIRYPRGFY